MEKKSIKDYTTEELKVMIYDQSKQVQLLQANIQAMDREVQTRPSMNGTKETKK